jgi:hypothetical protein
MARKDRKDEPEKPQSVEPEPDPPQAAEAEVPGTEEQRSDSPEPGEQIDGQGALVVGDWTGEPQPGDTIFTRDEEVFRLAEEAAMLGQITPTERAMLAFDLQPEHVLAAKELPQPDGAVEVVLVTRGGQKVRFPQDEHRVLSPMEKGDSSHEPKSEPAGIFPPRK